MLLRGAARHSRTLDKRRNAPDQEALQHAAIKKCGRRKAPLITQAGAATRRFGCAASTSNKKIVPNYGTQINYNVPGGTIKITSRRDDVE